VHDAQRIFRGALEALSGPGRVVDLPVPPEVPPPLSPAAAALCLALADLETPLWLDAAAGSEEMRAFLAFHCGAPLVGAPGQARFAVIAAAARMPPFEAFDAGTDEEPERSATLIVQVASLRGGEGPAPRVAGAGGEEMRTLRGPGVQSEAWVGTRGLPARFWSDVRANGARFPRGVDVLLVAGCRLAGLPRTVSVDEGD
jgi:alpha-D-ribose 1-methylphosphonate 5-triphosphate synthase subunit PhnH